MTGMKEGAGEDPFAGDDESATPESSDAVAADTDSSSDSTPGPTDERRPDQRRMQIPYKFRRDGVQDGRNRVPLFLQDDTKRAERDALRELEERFDDDVSLTDLREAVLKAGLQHLDQVEAHLKTWGYGMTFDD